MWKRRFPYEEYNKWSQDPAEKRRWTEALEKWGPKRVEAELSERFGAIAPRVARGLKLRHDHGSNYMSGDFQDEVECLGIEASPSFVREPQGNGVAERFIRTLKENLLWVRTFDTIEELRAALVEFATRYNETWLVARHGYRTPAQVRADQCRLDQNATADLKLAA